MQRSSTGLRCSARLAIPEELFRLSESPDRQVCAFVVKTLWSLYRDRGTTPGWTPPKLPQRRGKGDNTPEEQPEGSHCRDRTVQASADHQRR